MSHVTTVFELGFNQDYNIVLQKEASVHKLAVLHLIVLDKSAWGHCSSQATVCARITITHLHTGVHHT